MAKSYKRNYNHRHDYDDREEETFYDYMERTREHRRTKRLRNALKSKDIDDLLEFDDDY